MCNPRQASPKAIRCLSAGDAQGYEAGCRGKSPYGVLGLEPIASAAKPGEAGRRPDSFRYHMNFE